MRKRRKDTELDVFIKFCFKLTVLLLIFGFDFIRCSSWGANRSKGILYQFMHFNNMAKPFWPIDLGFMM